MKRAVDSQHAVSYSGRQSFFTTRDGQTMWAEIAVEARAGQGIDVEVLSRSGKQLVHGFSPTTVSSRVVDDDLLDLLAANYTLNGVGGATVAGRSATEISAWSLGQRAARWWLDDETGIVLWQELYDRTGAVALSTGFTSVTVSPAAEMMEHLPPRLVPTDRHDLALGRRRGLVEQLGLVLRAGPVRAVPGAAAHRPGHRPDVGAGGLQRRGGHGRRGRAARPAGRAAGGHPMGSPTCGRTCGTGPRRPPPGRPATPC